MQKIYLMRIINKYILLIIYQIQHSYSTGGTIRIIISFQFRKFGQVLSCCLLESRLKEKNIKRYIFKFLFRSDVFGLSCILWPIKNHSFSRRRFVAWLVSLLSNRRQFIRNPKYRNIACMRLVFAGPCRRPCWFCPVVSRKLFTWFMIGSH